MGGRPCSIEGPSGGAAIFSSSDGQTWSAFAPMQSDLLADVAFGNGVWVVTGDDGGFFLSNDSVQWTNASTDALSLARPRADGFATRSAKPVELPACPTNPHSSSITMD